VFVPAPWAVATAPTATAAAVVIYFPRFYSSRPIQTVERKLFFRTNGNAIVFICWQEKKIIRKKYITYR